jgi:hypothetical protein
MGRYYVGERPQAPAEVGACEVEGGEAGEADSK